MADEPKTYTQDEVDKIKAATADKSFKAGYGEAINKSEKNYSQKVDDNKAKTAELNKELNELRAYKKDQVQKDNEQHILGLIPKDAGVKISGQSRFVKEFYSKLHNKTGDDFNKAINEIKADKANALYFESDDEVASLNNKQVTTFNTLLKQNTSHPPKKGEYYPNTTIKKN